MGFSKLTGRDLVERRGHVVADRPTTSRDWSISPGCARLPKLIDLWTPRDRAVRIGVSGADLGAAGPAAGVGRSGVVVWTSLALVTGDVPFALMMCIASLAFVSPTVVRACESAHRASAAGRQAPSSGVVPDEMAATGGKLHRSRLAQ